MTVDGASLARVFWERMASNDFASVVPLLADGFTLTYPQSGERFDAVGMVRLNDEYPAEGPWTFRVDEVVDGGARAVTDVTVSDGAVTARAITFFTTEGGLITSMVEYWPEPFEPPPSRAHLR